ncbi:DNA cytosine methyltransferase [Rossellomorea aquimaris]|uniref:DNA cytosine methyltransferase n=1 Tax=Rossellomorea aquimaris TaxID=189382 RepID=UPI001CD30CA3|nr:DNA cytosine methyltransferase [Rossellomorea aquimaris]MCA1054311.1 DNA cytosine methyltransferase [Rossellomorea aquimaris]
MKNKQLKVVSLFSGCGGLDLGLEQAGMDVVWANDVDHTAVETYRFNMKNSTVIEGDIKKIDVDEIPDCDVLAAGFPCQPFSSAGSRKGVTDERGTLFEEAIRVIEAKKPLVVIFENVRGILSTKNLDGSLLLDSIVKTLDDIEPGYVVNYKLIRSSDYGVPQQRYRVIFVGIRKDLEFEYEFPLPTNSQEDLELTVGAAIKDVENLPNQNDVWEFSPQSKKLIPFINEGGSWKDIPYDKLPPRLKKIRDNMKKYRAPNFYRRFSRNEINGTITAAATPENCGIIHPTENRRYSVREIARIQSFPDHFVFVGNSLASKYKVIGNAVPPKLGQVIGHSIIEQLSTIDVAKLNNALNKHMQLELFDH